MKYSYSKQTPLTWYKIDTALTTPMVVGGNAVIAGTRSDSFTVLTETQVILSGKRNFNHMRLKS